MVTYDRIERAWRLDDPQGAVLGYYATEDAALRAVAERISPASMRILVDEMTMLEALPVTDSDRETLMGLFHTAVTTGKVDDERSYRIAIGYALQRQRQLSDEPQAPPVRVERDVCDDEMDPKRHGTEIGTYFHAGDSDDEITVYIDDDATNALRTPSAYVLGEEFALEDLARVLPRLCALVNSPQVRAAAQAWHERRAAYEASLPSLPPPPPALLAILERHGMSLERFIELAPTLLPILQAEQAAPEA